MIYKLLPTRVYRSYYGGKNLDILQNIPKPVFSRYPEDWISSVSLAYNPDNVVKNEGLSMTEDGVFLKDLIENDKKNMIGDRADMSLLFKLLDSSERLVIQCHPTRDFAKKHFNSKYGKTECWYILSDGGEIYIGFKNGITKEYFMELFQKQDVKEMLNCLHCFKVKKGDFIFVPGGVPHAIGANCFLAELQEPTDFMVIPEKVTPSGIKLKDSKIHGGLGYEKMFDCFEYSGLDREDAKKRFFLAPQKVNDNVLSLVDNNVTDMFKLEEITVDNQYASKLESYAILLVIQGNGFINGEKACFGDRFFMPENDKKLQIDGNMKVLVCKP
ncbi:MAG: mannose-6-phosphate isomerase [Clostridiales bacterium]|nr:mannose-6-phosphate isomerase [Clostridiales bacterium]